VAAGAVSEVTIHGDRKHPGPGAGFIRIERKTMALKNLKAIIIDLNYMKGILFLLDFTGE